MLDSTVAAKWIPRDFCYCNILQLESLQQICFLYYSQKKTEQWDSRLNFSQWISRNQSWAALPITPQRHPLSVRKLGSQSQKSVGLKTLEAQHAPIFWVEHGWTASWVHWWYPQPKRPKGLFELFHLMLEVFNGIWHLLAKSAGQAFWPHVISAVNTEKNMVNIPVLQEFDDLPLKISNNWVFNAILRSQHVMLLPEWTRAWILLCKSSRLSRMCRGSAPSTKT